MGLEILCRENLLNQTPLSGIFVHNTGEIGRWASSGMAVTNPKASATNFGRNPDDHPSFFFLRETTTGCLVYSTHNLGPRKKKNMTRHASHTRLASKTFSHDPMSDPLRDIFNRVLRATGSRRQLSICGLPRFSQTVIYYM